MCSLGFARSLGFALVSLAICCIIANVLLFVPYGNVDFVKNGHLIKYVWTFMGSVAVLITAFIFMSVLKCANSCGTENSAMCGSVLASLIGLAGSGYCFISSTMDMLKGPHCLVNSTWTYPFQNDNAKYLFAHESWYQCEEPDNIVEWNVTLLSILLGLSLIEFLICFVQFISGLVSAVCRPCCYKQQYSLSA